MQHTSTVGQESLLRRLELLLLRELRVEIVLLITAAIAVECGLDKLGKYYDDNGRNGHGP